jgi:type III restriction enzyme
MGNTGFRFDPRQQYQLDAIAAVVDLFDGQPRDADKLAVTMRGAARQAAEGQLAVDTAQEIGAIGNNLVLDEAAILANLQAVQDRNGLEQSESLAGGKLDFDIEMETGTGKTYVYLRTIFELAQHYGFGKFIILVPSVAIREGVNTSIRLMREHFRDLYPALPFDAGVYRGDRAEEVQAFATATGVQILVMTIDSVRGNANTRIIHQTRDRLNGLRPIDYLKTTRPVVIMDEPQNMESLLSQSAVGELDPAFTLRYSATHRQLRNLVYRLDPVDAHDLGLVKQIVVDSVAQQGADAAPYLKLIDVTNTRGTFKARLELSCRTAKGSVARKTKTVKRDDDLATATGNPAYDGWRINGMSIDPVSVELSNHGTLLQGDSIGGANGAIYREMIRQTILEHFRKEAALRDRGIKVLSLFFVDKVAGFLGDGTNNEDANGEFVKWFDEAFVEERNRSAQYRELLPQEPRDLRRAYFSQLKKKGGKVEFQDSSGATKADDDAYELIMQDKQRLLDMDEPVRFIFSHSALREGWDNPNVFQICTLREMGTETERRQTLGRGLRLPVAKTEHGYERIADRGIATLTVIANESYTAFADSLQNEYKAAGVAIGQVRSGEFAKLARLDADGKATDEFLGYKASQEIFQHLHSHNYLRDGKTTPMFTPDSTDFSLNLPEALKPYEAGIIERIRDAGIGKYVKNAKDRKARKFNKGLYATPEFEEFWNAISRKTTYRVQVGREAIVGNAIYAIKREDRINPLRIEVTRAGVRVSRGGTQSQVLGATVASLDARYDLPDIIGELQHATSLTRRTLVDIVKGSNRLAEFIGNPNDFIAMVLRCIKGELAKLLIDGIQYETLDGSIYELRELQADGLEERERFFDRMVEIHNTPKTDFDHVVYDSEVEREFAEMLDSRADIKLFMKLPAKFKVPTPVGDYNPDWAIIRQVDGENRIYMIRETKSTHDRNKRRPSENAKIDAAVEHFKAIDIGYDVTVPPPPTWNL